MAGKHCAQDRGAQHTDGADKTHVASVLRKLGLRDRVQAVIVGYETGLVRPGETD